MGSKMGLVLVTAPQIAKIVKQIHIVAHIKNWWLFFP